MVRHRTRGVCLFLRYCNNKRIVMGSNDPFEFSLRSSRYPKVAPVRIMGKASNIWAWFASPGASRVLERLVRDVLRVV